MLVSAPFDDWWHNAYGLDVKIISPPHMVLAAGFFGINFGAIMLMLAFLNRATGASRVGLQRMFLSAYVVVLGSITYCSLASRISGMRASSATATARNARSFVSPGKKKKKKKTKRKKERKKKKKEREREREAAARGHGQSLALHYHQSDTRRAVFGQHGRG